MDLLAKGARLEKEIARVRLPILDEVEDGVVVADRPG